jgi:hypothetical protein
VRPDGLALIAADSRSAPLQAHPALCSRPFDGGPYTTASQVQQRQVMCRPPYTAREAV